MEVSFGGRVAAVTGAGKGLGKAYALWLASHGCAVVVNNRTHPGVPSSAQLVVDEIIAAGGRAAAHEGAIDDQASANALVELAVTKFGKLDIMICNAGVMPVGGFADIDFETITRTVSINILGTILPLQAAWRQMLAQGYGRVVLTGSTVGTYGHNDVAVYGATRASAIGLARSLTLETPPGVDFGINVILPFAYTGMSAESMDAVMDQATIDSLTADKIAPAVGWLCSDANHYTGKIFHAAAQKLTRVALVESASVPASDPNTLTEALFDFAPFFEPSASAPAVGRLLSGMISA